jgi:hypothetical protein
MLNISGLNMRLGAKQLIDLEERIERIEEKSESRYWRKQQSVGVYNDIFVFENWCF